MSYVLIGVAVAVAASFGFMMAAFFTAGKVADLDDENARLRADLAELRERHEQLTDRDARGRFVRRGPGEAA